MIIPACLRKQEIEQKFKERFYTEDMLYENGYLGNWCPDISDEPGEGHYQYAVVNSEGKLIGYIQYRVDFYSSGAYNFGIISFDKGNPLMGRAVIETMNKLINVYKLHRIEWRMVSGNPVQKSYDKFCKIYGGTRTILHDTFKDETGNYRDSYIYEIIFNSDKDRILRR